MNEYAGRTLIDDRVQLLFLRESAIQSIVIEGEELGIIVCILLLGSGYYLVELVIGIEQKILVSYGILDNKAESTLLLRPRLTSRQND